MKKKKEGMVEKEGRGTGSSNDGGERKCFRSQERGLQPLSKLITPELPSSFVQCIIDQLLLLYMKTEAGVKTIFLIN